MSSGEIRDRVRFQLSRLAELAGAAGVRLGEVSPAGPLADHAARDRRVARALAHGIQTACLGLTLSVPEPGLLAREGRALGLRLRAAP